MILRTGVSWASYLVYSEGYGHVEKCQKCLIFLFSADGSKEKVTVWTKYLSISERSYLSPLENAMDYWVLSYH